MPKHYGITVFEYESPQSLTHTRYQFLFAVLGLDLYGQIYLSGSLEFTYFETPTVTVRSRNSLRRCNLAYLLLESTL